MPWISVTQQREVTDPAEDRRISFYCPFTEVIRLFIPDNKTPTVCRCLIMRVRDKRTSSSSKVAACDERTSIDYISRDQRPQLFRVGAYPSLFCYSTTQRELGYPFVLTRSESQKLCWQGSVRKETEAIQGVMSTFGASAVKYFWGQNNEWRYKWTPNHKAKDISIFTALN